ncbi:MlaD family protein [Thioclava sp. GXIMD4216]|uniref:PqiB family protein n=1 Tax=unclassified Thioclava TaxID=2621713 RepID=UPI0030D3B5D1
MTEDPKPADLQKTQAKKPIWARLSLIWFVPLFALLITLYVAWHTYSDRGTLIYVDFKDATGITAGETVLKYREVSVGTVETVGFTKDLGGVRVGIRVHNDVAKYIDKDARFWIVKPELSAQGISRLDTVLSGGFIQGWWDNKISDPQTEFEGLDKQPVTEDPNSGTQIILRARDAGGLAEGAPVIYRGLTVGKIQNLRLDEGGSGVLIDAFINKPYNARLTTTTRFWDASGISVNLGANGVSVNMRSLASIVQGGVEFDTLATGGSFIQNGFPYRLFKDENEARNSIFGGEFFEPARYTLLFDEPVQGIEIGTKVEFRGVEAGEVTDLSIKVSEDSLGTKFARQQVVISLSPERLGLERNTDNDIVTQFLENEVANGLRARITGTGLLGQTLVIELTDVPDRPKAEMDTKAAPYPTIPTAPQTANSLATSAEGVFKRVESLPIEELMTSATQMFQSITAIAGQDRTKQIPDELAGTLGEIRSLVNELNKNDAGKKASDAIDNVSQAADSVMTEIEGLNDTLASADKAAQRIADMPLGDIGDKVDGILGDLRKMLNTDDAEALPQNLSDTLQQLAGLLRELREGGVAEKLNGTLTAAQDAAGSIQSASDRLPALTKQLQDLTTQAQGLVGAYGDRSNFNSQVMDTMRDLRRTIDAVGSLARMIERNPQAFITGR